MGLKRVAAMVRSGFLDEGGATAVEYAIMVSLIAVVIIVAVTAVGTALNESLECVASAVGALPGVDACVE